MWTSWLILLLEDFLLVGFLILDILVLSVDMESPNVIDASHQERLIVHQLFMVFLEFLDFLNFFFHLFSFFFDLFL
jgi:hypothetical protein